jgi:hypothetical protein
VRWNPTLEQQFFEGLALNPGIRGLELPWLGSLHPHDDEWLVAHLPHRFDVVVTDIGATVGSVAKNAGFGLASRDDDGRRAALTAARRLRDDVERLCSAVGRASVIAVELHSAPLARNGSPDALCDSLVELADWDWSGAQLLIEHCDAEVDGRSPEKGYLSLDSEITALRTADAGIRMSVNWGRSAIELRSAERVVEHIRLAADAGVLSALVLSGAGGKAGDLGPAWADAHHPFARSDDFPEGDETSELTPELTSAALAAAGTIDWLGIKMSLGRPGMSVADRVSAVDAAITLTSKLLVR